MNKLLKYIKNPSLIILYLMDKNLLWWLDDEKYLKLKYRLILKSKLNLKEPKTFNEKIQWLKLHDRKPEYTKMVDKYEAKKYAANIIGEKYIIPTLGVYDKFDDIDFDKLPNQFVIKCTHDSGGLVIVKDKSKLDIKSARKKINKCLKSNFYYYGREWPYKNVKPRIIVEKYMKDNNRIVPEDYKIYCMNGKPKYIVVFHNRFNENAELSETVYDTNWKPQNVSFDEHFSVSNIIEPKPECLDEMLEICSKICKNFIQVRVDFYIIENQIYFGEITLSTASGFRKMIPEELDEILGKEIKLPKNSGGGYLLKTSNMVLNIYDERNQLNDYKLFCFNGKVKIVLVCSNRFKNLKESFFDENWNKYDFTEGKHDIDETIGKPYNFEKMKILAEKLSKNIKFLRVDFYEIDRKIYFGEFTFYPASGYEKFEPEIWDERFGKLIEL